MEEEHIKEQGLRNLRLRVFKTKAFDEYFRSSVHQEANRRIKGLTSVESLRELWPKEDEGYEFLVDLIEKVSAWSKREEGLERKRILGLARELIEDIVQPLEMQNSFERILN